MRTIKLHLTAFCVGAVTAGAWWLLDMSIGNYFGWPPSPLGAVFGGAWVGAGAILIGQQPKVSDHQS